MVNEVMEKILKRSSDDCKEDPTDLKMKKLEEVVSPSDNEQSSSEQSGSDSSTEATSNSLTTNSQYSFIGGAVVKNGNIKLFSLSSPKKNFEELSLTEGKVFEQMMHEFSKANPLQRISYGKSKYELVHAYAEFWENLFPLPKYTTGSEIKLVNSSLDETTLLAIAKILKKGWEDVRFFPKKLAQPFLEACIFRKSEDQLVFKPKMFYQYIEKEELKIIESNGRTINNENIKVFEKYYPQAPISIGDTIESACKKVLGKIMFQDVENVRCVWTEELFELLEIEKFKFLEEEQDTIPIGSEKDVDTIAPHRLWSTFFYTWSADMKEFYLRLLQNYIFHICNICDKSCDCGKNIGVCVDAKHIISTREEDPESQRKKHAPMFTERYNEVFNKILDKVKVALTEYRRNFTLGKENWELLEMNENNIKPWPQELAMLEPLNLFPHIVLHCSSPRKRALIMDLTVPWDHWATHGSINHCKIRKYSIMVKTLQDHGFEAEYYDVKVGARGIWSEDLYQVFDELCGMESSEITKTMEEISKIIIEINYKHHNCKDRNE